MATRNVTWVLVADGARARVLAFDRTGNRLTELPERAFSGSRQRSRDLGSDKPGRTFDSVGAGRHAKAPATDPHRRAESEFLRDVVEWLADPERAGRFDRLVIVSPPRALGEIRRFLPEALARRVVRELALDLTRSDPSEIQAHLGGPTAV